MADLYGNAQKGGGGLGLCRLFSVLSTSFQVPGTAGPFAAFAVNLFESDRMNYETAEKSVYTSESYPVTGAKVCAGNFVYIRFCIDAG